jgi:hypothetical protein
MPKDGCHVTVSRGGSNDWKKLKEAGMKAAANVRRYAVQYYFLGINIRVPMRMKRERHPGGGG